MLCNLTLHLPAFYFLLNFVTRDITDLQNGYSSCKFFKFLHPFEPWSFSFASNNKWITLLYGSGSDSLHGLMWGKTSGRCLSLRRAKIAEFAEHFWVWCLFQLCKLMPVLSHHEVSSLPPMPWSNQNILLCWTFLKFYSRQWLDLFGLSRTW